MNKKYPETKYDIESLVVFTGLLFAVGLIYFLFLYAVPHIASPQPQTKYEFSPAVYS